MSSGKRVRTKMRGTSRQGTGASIGKLRLRAIHTITSIMDAAMSRPGTMPPMKSAPTEAPDTRA